MPWKANFFFPRAVEDATMEAYGNDKIFVFYFQDINGRCDKTTSAIVIAATSYVDRIFSFPLMVISILYAWRNNVPEAIFET